MADMVRKLPATANRWTRSEGLLFSAMNAGSAVWCKLPKNEANTGVNSSMNSLDELMTIRPITAPTPSPRMNEALRPMRSEISPAGRAVAARAMKPTMRRVPMKAMS